MIIAMNAKLIIYNVLTVYSNGYATKNANSFTIQMSLSSPMKVS